MRRALSALTIVAALASCVPPPRVAAPPPRLTPTVPPAPPPVALGSDWNDWPRTPGDWSYRRYDGRSSATFGSEGVGALVLSCDGAGRISVNRAGAAIGPLTIRTSSTTRVVPVAPLGEPRAGVQAALAATDPLLDAIAFSRGRFTVEQPGSPPLVLPPYAEIGRVIEDCRG